MLQWMRYYKKNLCFYIVITFMYNEIIIMQKNIHTSCPVCGSASLLTSHRIAPSPETSLKKRRESERRNLEAKSRA